MSPDPGPPAPATLAGSPSTDRTPSAVRLGLAGVLVVAALAYGWGLTRVPLETYYAAAVRAMATSWHAFAFGAFDPDATITMDKLPGSFWVQALCVRLLGPAPWVLVLPQVIEGVGTVAAAYLAVRHLVGPRAGLLAAGVLALSPAAVALARGNVADPLMLLLLTLAAAAVARALRARDAVPAGPVVLAGVAVGLAFQAKMVEAWLVLPALALAVLVAGAGSWARRLGVTLAGGVVAAVVSLAWVVVVDLLPASGRPAVDGSPRNSLLEQTFVYNGFGRLGESPLQILSGQGLALTSPGLAPGGSAGWDRLLVGSLGRDAGWLLPLALLVLVAGLVSRRGRPRTDPLRAAYLLFGVWLLVAGVAVSLGAVVNVYYAASIAPTTAALVATGAAHLWRCRDRRGAWAAGAAGLAVTVVYGVVLAARSLTDPVEARLAVVAGAVTAVVGLVGLLLAAAAVRPRTGAGRPDSDVVGSASSRSPVSGGRAAGAALVVGLVAVLVLPATASLSVVALGRGSFDTPFESVRQAVAVRSLFVTTPRAVARTRPGIERTRDGAPDLMAAQSSAVASVFAYPTGEEVVPIGGFTGTGPTPTVDELRDDVARGRFHLVLAFPGPDPRVAWLAAHCPSPHRTPPPFVDFYCTPPDAR